MATQAGINIPLEMIKEKFAMLEQMSEDEKSDNEEKKDEEQSEQT